ncbi:MAG: dimethylarginine dimethylaminohydrolase [Pseudomonadota bacterium]
MMTPYQFDSAIVRTPSRSVVQGLRDGNGPNPDYLQVIDEHQHYVAALRAAGLAVIELPALEAFPDALFVEDPALVFTQGAILLNPGAPSRQGEAETLRDTLTDHFATVLDLEDGVADGGDILTTPQGVMIGLSGRTNRRGAEALQRGLATLGLDSKIVQTPAGVLHFKSDCALLDETRILSTSRLAASGVFSGFDVIEVPQGEDAAANCVRINDALFVSRDYPRTSERLAGLGYALVELATTQIARIDAGLSCMSLRWRRQSID